MMVLQGAGVEVLLAGVGMLPAVLLAGVEMLPAVLLPTAAIVWRRCYRRCVAVLPWHADAATMVARRCYQPGGGATGGAAGGAASAAREGWRCYLPELTALMHAEVDKLPAALYTGVDV
jgi:hypothetical protein